MVVRIFDLMMTVDDELYLQVHFLRIRHHLLRDEIKQDVIFVFDYYYSQQQPNEEHKFGIEVLLQIHSFLNRSSRGAPAELVGNIFDSTATDKNCTDSNSNE